MKILIIPSWYPNIKNHTVGSFFQEQALLLSENGYDVKILHGVKNIGIKAYIKRVIFKFQKSITLNNNYLVQDPPAFSFFINLFSLWSEKRKHHFFCKKYKKAYIEILKTGWKPDLIHAQCTLDGGLAAMHLNELFDIPYVIIEHQVFLLSKHSFFKKQLIINALEKADKVGAVSHHQKRCILMEEINCTPSIVWNFINEDKFFLNARKPDKTFRIISISYPSFIKDMETFFKSIAAFKALCKDNSIEVIIIGNNSFGNLNGANTLEFEKLAEKYQVSSICKLIPYLSRDEIVSSLNTADVYVSTSIAETFGVSVREAMYCGVPVVSTKNGGVDDSINEKTGVLVDIGDFEAIANSLLKIKNKEMNFDPIQIREFAIAQCGKSNFLTQMQKFYTIQ